MTAPGAGNDNTKASRVIRRGEIPDSDNPRSCARHARAKQGNFGSFIVRKPAKTRATLKDVARVAEVSLSAVSYVLNDNEHARRISAETKQRIHQAAQKLGYQSDPIGLALQRGYTNQVVLLIVSWNLATSHAATAMAISRAAVARGLEVTVQVTEDDAAAEAFLRRRVLHNVGGILVLWDSPAIQQSHLKELATEGVPVIDLLPDAPEGVSVVTSDRERAFLVSTQHLISLGHQRIGMICDSLTRAKTTLRKLEGYRRALREAGLPGDEGLIENVTEYGFEGGHDGFQRLINRHSDVTGIVCINDAMALGVIAAAAEVGLRCPADVSVIGFGDAPEGKYFHPRLTTFALASKQVAEKAIDVVLQHRKVVGSAPALVLVSPELVVRESTGTAKRQ